VIARLVIDAKPSSSSSAACVAPATVRCALFVESFASFAWAASHPRWAPRRAVTTPAARGIVAKVPHLLRIVD